MARSVNGDRTRTRMATKADHSSLGSQSGNTSALARSGFCFFLSVSVSVSVSVLWGRCTTSLGCCCNVASALRDRSRCFLERSVLVSLSYWRRCQATMQRSETRPTVSKATNNFSIISNGSKRIAATRRDGMSILPPSLRPAAFSRIACHAAMTTEREQPTTSAASANLASVTVPS